MPESPNVLLLLSDQHRHDALGAAGGGVRTPTLDGLAGTGTHFAGAYCGAPSATPSRLTLLSGRRVRAAGAWDDRSRLPDLPLLPEPFAEAGYDTCLVGTLGVEGRDQFAGFDARPYGDHTGTGGHQFDPITTPLSRGSPGAAGRHGPGGRFGDRYDPIDPERRHPDPWQSLTGDAGPTTIPESQRQERVVAEESLAWLRERADSGDPWLLCASFNSPHFPLTAPERHFDRYYPDGVDLPDYGDPPFDHPVVAAKREADRTSDLYDRQRTDLDEEQVRRSRAAYFAAVDYLDETLGDLLRDLDAGGFLDDTVVVYASTQGQLAGDHGLWWTRTWHEAATRVPLVVRTPAHRRGDRTGGRVETPVSLLDLYPTLCGLAGVDSPEGLDGRDLSESVETAADPDRGPVVADYLTPTWGAGTEFRVVRDGRYKYVAFRDAPDLLFDLAADPDETTDLADDPTHADASDRLAGHRPDFEAAAADREAAVDARPGERLPISKGTSGNTYLLGDGRVIDAGSMLYKPDTLADVASAVYDDYPGEGAGAASGEGSEE